LSSLAGRSVAQAETPIPPPPERWVADRAGFLSPAASAELDARLADYAARTGHQLLVYIDRTTGGVPIEDWTVRAFQRWRVGRRGIDDGMVLFLFSDDHRMRIEVGYGLEGRVTDVTAKRIIEERVLPRIRAGDHDGAIRAGVEGMINAVGPVAGAPATATAHQPPPAPLSTWKLIAGVILFAILIVILVTHPSLAWLLLLNIGSGRGGGGGWGGGGGGGGFSGGGGRSGGGGASGSW
jgi:uncharacterized protein